MPERAPVSRSTTLVTERVCPEPKTKFNTRESGDPAVGFYQACGWTIAETFDRLGEKVTVLTTAP